MIDRIGCTNNIDNAKTNFNSDIESCRIKQLSPLIANQIAAGEVIERPASVVKELLENSQDAGALNISIELGFAGLNQIKISDDGFGICQEDLPLAIQQHATSKIACLDDLYSIQSMGFRGEALASISAVSKISITSRTKTQAHAAKLVMENDKFVIVPSARVVGTTIEVLDLFYNAPVRKNFLRGERTELQYIEDIIKRFALAAPHISISVKHNTKEIFNVPASTCLNTRLLRIKKIFGSQFINSAISVDVASLGMRISGLLGSPSYQRSQRDKQWIYLNNRMLRDKLLQHAIMQIYQDYLPPGRFPACLLYLDMPPDFVDVNVHPTKHEVRFKSPRDVHDFLISSLGSQIKSKPILKKEIQDVFKPEISSYTSKTYESFHALNSEFVIFYQGSEPYLLDIRMIYINYCHNILLNSNYPLNSRPLLVPVQYLIQYNSYTYFENIQQELNEFGITFDFFDTNTLVIRAIPLNLPQLDIKQFFEKVDFKKSTNKLELQKILTECQIFNAKISSEQEISELISYSRENNFLVKYARHLNSSMCKNIFEYAKKE